MPYRILSCTICSTKVRFIKNTIRNMVVCPRCGTGMDLAPKDMVPRLKLMPSRCDQPRPESPPEECPKPVTAVVMSAPAVSRHMLLGIAAAALIAGLLFVGGLLNP